MELEEIVTSTEQMARDKERKEEKENWKKVSNHQVINRQHQI